MARTHSRHKRSLDQKYPPSPACGCEICLGYCARPGWWTVEEAARAIQAGYAGRMMLEIAPEQTFGVLAPAFKGNEGNFALSIFQGRGCTFLEQDRCQLHGTGLQPLECRFCHHDRPGQGQLCHNEIELGWNTPAGQALVERWSKITGFWDELKEFRKETTARRLHLRSRRK